MASKSGGAGQHGRGEGGSCLNGNSIALIIHSLDPSHIFERSEFYQYLLPGFVSEKSGGGNKISIVLVIHSVDPLRSVAGGLGWEAGVPGVENDEDGFDTCSIGSGFA